VNLETAFGQFKRIAADLGAEKAGKVLGISEVTDCAAGD